MASKGRNRMTHAIDAALYFVVQLEIALLEHNGICCRIDLMNCCCFAINTEFTIVRSCAQLCEKLDLNYSKVIPICIPPTLYSPTDFLTKITIGIYLLGRHTRCTLNRIRRGLPSNNMQKIDVQRAKFH